MPALKDQIRQFLVDNFLLGNQNIELTDSTSFMETQLLDSTGFLELVAYLEETFGITVADEEMVPENLDSLTAVEAYVTRKRG